MISEEQPRNLEKPMCSAYSILLFLTFLISGALPPPAWAAQKDPAQKFPKNPLTETVTFLSRNLTIDRIYKSMQGPSDSQSVTLTNDNPPELLWITSYRVEVMEPDGQTPALQEFMCHNNLDFNSGQHSQMMGWSHLATGRMFTLSQGQFSIDLPEGFGIPVMSNENFSLSNQVLNHNIKNINTQVRNKVTFDFIRDKNLVQPLKPLFPTNGFVMALLEGKDGFFGLDQPDEVQKQATCLPGAHAPGIKSAFFNDQFGRKFSGHWVVKLGKTEQKTLVTKWLRIPYDTTVHFIAVHVHPFCESLELRDITTGKTVFKSTMKGPPKGVGLEKVDYLSNTEGIPVYKDHEYEMISNYNNTSGVEQDAMATFFLYLYDKEFKNPAFANAATAQTYMSPAR